MSTGEDDNENENGSFSRLLLVSSTLIILVGVLFRFLYLGNTPGINGDEAFFGVKAIDFLQGDPISWRTGSGVPLNPLYFFPVVALHAIFEPSFFLLRIFAGCCGAASVAFIGWKFRNVMDPWLALSVTLLVASLPISIAYSRIGWDPCQSILVTAIALYFSFARRKLLTFLAFCACVIVHPTNIFIAPILLAPFVLEWLDRIREKDIDTAPQRIGMLIKIAVGGLVGLIACGALLAALDILPGRTGEAVKRLISPEEFAIYCYHFGNLFNGISTYDYFVGGDMVVPDGLHLLLFWIGLILAAVCSFVKLKSDWAFPVFFLLAAFVFYVVAGAQKVRPDDARYALWSVVPGTVLFVTLLGKVLNGKRTCVVCAVISVGCLISFHFNFFDAIQSRNAVSHRTFLTGETEPKKIAAELIRDDPVENRKVVFAQDWWVYWPVRYLLAREENVRITIPGDPIGSGFPGDFEFREDELRDDDVIYYLGFYDPRMQVDADRIISGYGNTRILVLVNAGEKE